MNILFVHSSNELYGADRSLLRLIEHLNPEVYCPHVALPNDIPFDGLLSQRLENISIPCLEIKLGILRRRYFNLWGMALWGWRTILSTLRLSRYCRKHQVKLLHSNSTAVFAGALAAKVVGIPHVWQVHETITEHVVLLRIIAWMLVHFADVVLTVSGPTQDNLLMANPKLTEITQVLHNGIDPEPFLSVDEKAVAAWRKAWGIDESDIVIGTIGRLSARKGQKELIQATALVLEQCPNIHLTLVGSTIPGEDWLIAELQKLTWELDIQNKVHWVNFQTDVSSLMSTFDIFVLPSILPESFPTTVLEAMAAGKPIVASAAGGTVEQIERNITGFLVQPGNLNKLAAALVKLIKNSDQRADMGLAGRQRLLNNFTIEKYVRGVEAVYQQLCD